MIPPRSGRFFCAAILALCLGGVAARGDDAAKPLSPAELAARIDALIAQRWAERGITSAPLAGDAEWLRRVTLDLAGHIAPEREVRDFLADKAADKRDRVVARLLSGPDYPRHMRNIYDVVMLGRDDIDGRVNRAAWRGYLEASFAADKPWDLLTREILAADGREESLRPATSFVVNRRGNLDMLASDTTRVFMGVQVQCARCHDHPHVPEWLQDSYYGIAAFFNRTFIHKGSKGTVLAEKADGEVKFTPIKGAEELAVPMLLSGEQVPDPKLDSKDLYVVAPGKDAPDGPIPRYSRRGEFARRATAPANPYFKRAIANRLWYQLLGRGIVVPVDRMDSLAPPSHPALLDLLADQVVAHGFHLRPVIEGIARSRVYQLSSRWESAAEPPAAELFAVAVLRPLAAEQLAESIAVASGSLEAGVQADAAAEAKRRVRVLEEGYGPITELFRDDGSEFRATAQQTLFVTNSEQFQRWIARKPQNLADRLIATADSAALADTLYVATLGRPPLPEEATAVQQYLASRSERRDAAIEQLVWALVASSEFRFNH